MIKLIYHFLLELFGTNYGWVIQPSTSAASNMK
jgi:hypothetical protein